MIRTGPSKLLARGRAQSLLGPGSSRRVESTVQRATLATSQTRCKNVLTPDNINQNVRHLEYAVRGALVMRAVQLRRELSEGHKKPFKSIIAANIGDCQAMLQRPITFIRQVIACATNTRLLESSDTPNDVKDKVREILGHCDGGSVGAYTDSSGVELIRRHVAEYIERRDGGLKCDYLNVFLSGGASEAIKALLAFINQSRRPGQRAGVMVPIPQYPLYSATLCEFGIDQVNYYLDEQHDWSLSVDELERAYAQSASQSDIRALVVVNPGNPTGSVLSEENIVEIINFAHERGLMLIADEVYQHNVYDDDCQFHSFKRVMLEKSPHRLELASLMSSSKGFMGECGLRGGYGELCNFSDELRHYFYKGRSSWVCSSVLGQIAMDCVVDPPKAGQESYELFQSEKNKVLAELKRKAKLVTDTLNSVEGVAANRVAGAMYSFPRLELPARAVQEARSRNLEPDAFYAQQFLENYGVCVVPGTGFGQRPGSYHFRTTILPQPDVFEDMMDRFKKFHADFLNKYS